MTQTTEILKHLQRNGSITPMIALRRYGCYRLAARINDLRAKGHGIETNLIERNHKRFAMYTYHSRADR